jgi:hypothetical protein
MAFPNNPSDGDATTVNNIVYIYNATKGVWNKANIATAFTSTIVQLGNLNVTGNLTGGNVYVSNSIQWAANNQPLSDPAGTAVALAIALG